MQLLTKHFGELEIDERKVIDFPTGLPGFQDCKQFILLDCNGQTVDKIKPKEEYKTDDFYANSFYWLQSVENGNLAFVLLDICTIMPGYNPIFYDEQLKELGASTTGFLILNIAVIPEDINNMTVNLRAPVLINFSMCLGKQLIAANEEYHVRHKVLEEIIKQGDGV